MRITRKTVKGQDEARQENSLRLVLSACNDAINAPVRHPEHDKIVIQRDEIEKKLATFSRLPHAEK